MSRGVRAATLTIATLLAVFADAARAYDSAPAETPLAVAPAASAPVDCPPPPAPLTSDEMMAGLRHATDGGLLWKATKDGHASYLYGTIHIAKRDWLFPGPKVIAAMRASDVVALELDMTDPAVASELQRGIAVAPGSPELPPALAARLRARMIEACVDPAALAHVRPEMRAVTVELMGGQRLGLFPAYGIDMMLGGMGHVMKKEVRGLETPESQLDLLVSDDPAETARSVRETLDEMEGGAGERILDRMAGDWRRGDLADLAAYGQWCNCLDTPAQRADFVKLIDDRNAVMADKIARWHGEGKSLFVAVGSLHMIGDVGLPRLLQARGFVVERVAFDGER